MAGTAIRGRLNWVAAKVAEVAEETAGVATITFAFPDWRGHLPGQHVDVRLVAPDGYQAQRSYSIANPADGDRVALTVERLDDGEVSTYLTDVLEVGDEIELRGPIGGYFVWEPSRGGPLLLVAGGSGVVPLMAMLRARVAAGSDVPVRLLYSSRDWEQVIYRDELERLAGEAGVEIVHTITRTHRPAGRGTIGGWIAPCSKRLHGRPRKLRWCTCAGRRASSRLPRRRWSSSATIPAGSSPSGSGRRGRRRDHRRPPRRQRPRRCAD